MIKIGNIIFEKKPLLLAPMEDVSDPPFRYLCKQYGADIMFTEFIASEGLIRDAKKSIKKLQLTDYERPIAIQIFGNKISSMVEAAKIAEQANPDFIDINYGCPVKKIAMKGSGAGMLKDIDFMVEMTSEIVKAVNLPVTVKTRLGWDNSKKNIVEIAERLQDVGIAAITIHGRTRTQMYKGEADWTLIGEVKNNQRMKIPVFGNGDVDSPEKAKLMYDKYGVDGIMIGRACVGKPWLFNQIKQYLDNGELIPEPRLKEKVEMVKTHFEKSLEWKGLPTGIFEMRRQFANYFKGLPNFKTTRLKLLTSEDTDEIINILDTIAINYKDY